jgi:acetoin utilization deacetylase AcuC-like enzyme
MREYLKVTYSKTIIMSITQQSESLIPTCFSPLYAANTPTASMRKLKPVAETAVAAGLAELIDPGTINANLLRQLHSPKYVDAFLSGEGKAASSQGWKWTPEIRDGVLAINAGQIKAAELAFENGIAANVAQGFHHAGYEHGEAFCTFNGLALLAQQFPAKKIFVLDCDEHGGNGTSEFTERLPNLFNYSICGSHWDFRQNDRSVLHRLMPIGENFEPYKAALKSAFKQIEKWAPDLVVYQAGADPHIDDPLGTLEMTTDQMFSRDHIVFSFCAHKKIPVMFVLAGGYQEPIETKLVPLHLNTFRAAKEVYGA